MRAMKDSGLQWLGEVPSDWTLTRIAGLYSVRNEKVSDKDFPPLSVTNKGILPQLETATKTNDGDNRKLVRVGDFAINSRSDRRGSCGISPYDGSVSLINIVMKPRKKMSPRYYDWLFHTVQFGDENYIWGHGIVDDLWTTGWQEMKKIIVPVPALDEQERIADFLDGKCAEINSLVADVQAQTDVLEQYKRSVITETVTKGLNPDVEMKDSGIEWVGMIPSHWPVHPVYTYFGERKNKNKFGTEDNLLSLSYGRVIRKDINTSDGLLPESFNTYNIVESGDIIIRPTDLQNDKRSLRTGLVKEHGIITSAYIDLCPIKKVDSRFFHYLLHAYDVMKVFYNMGNGVRQGLNYSEFSRLMVFEPTYDEQVAIADYLDGKMGEIDIIIEQKKEQLSVLEAYKKSLIFEYATGKKEVPALITAVMVDPNVILLGKLPKLLSQQKGKIYNQKVLYLLNIYLGLNLGVQYYRYKHGPYDVRLDSYIDTLIENGWCVKTVNSGAENLEIGPNYGAFEEKYGLYFSEYVAEIKNLIQFVQPMKRSQIERVATLFAVWNDMILDGNSTPTEAEIVSEVMSGWTKNKANFAYDTWLGTLNKMRNNSIVPKGQGLHTLPRDC